MRTFILALLAFVGTRANAASFGTTCSADQVNILCPQTIVSGSSPTWSGQHTFLQGITLPDGTVISSTAPFGGGGGGSAPAPTRQVLTSTTAATYTTPANAVRLFIRMVGGGGGGGGWSPMGDATNGVDGSSSSFNSVDAAGGGAGHENQDFGYSGPGGFGGAGAASFRSQGGPGVSGSAGGSSLLGGGGNGASQGLTPGNSAQANTGGGGAPGGSTGGVGYSSGGGAGEYVELIIDNPSPSYSYIVGDGGLGGDAGTGVAGGAGGSGVIIVDEYYSNGSGGGPTVSTGVILSTSGLSGISVADTNFVAVSTLTANLVGGLGLVGSAQVNIHNTSGAPRDYTIRVTNNGTPVANDFESTVRASDYGIVSLQWHEVLTVAGAQDYVIEIKSNNATGTQIALSQSLIISER